LYVLDGFDIHDSNSKRSDVIVTILLVWYYTISYSFNDSLWRIDNVIFGCFLSS
jgi:hypothetical protein